MTLHANEQGVIEGTFTIPENIPAGAKTVAFVGAKQNGSRGSAVFVGQGTLNIQTWRQVNSITTVWVDPVAQTFVLETDTQVCGVDLWFLASGGDARVQLRETANGFPTGVVLAEKHLPQSLMIITGGGHTRILFDTPVRLSANTEYALVVMCDDGQTALAVAEIGKFDRLAQTWVVSQPYTVGVLLSSSNASTWTAHQDKDLAFRLLAADFTSAAQVLDLGSAMPERAATDMLLLSLADVPTAKSRIAYELSLPDESKVTIADGQSLVLENGVSGQIGIKATLLGDRGSSPVLYPGTMLVCGEVAKSADYYTRSIPAGNAVKVILIYDAIIPTGAAVTPELRIDEGAWQPIALEGTVNQGDGLVEYRFKQDLSGADLVKARLTLTGTASARPRVRNIRLLALA